MTQLQKKFNFKLTDVWTMVADFYIYSECTADGYEVFIATDDFRQINIAEDVHYYDSDLSGVLVESILYNFENGDGLPILIYVEDMEADYVEYAMDELREQDDD